MRLCRRCDIVKPAADFYPNRAPDARHRATRHSGCRACRRAAARAYAAAHYQPRARAS